MVDTVCEMPPGDDAGDASLLRLNQAGARLSVARSLVEIVSILRETARQIAGSDGIAVVLREDGHCFYAAEDAFEPLWQGRRFRLEECISGWAMLNCRTVVIPDIEADPRVPIEAYRRTSMRSLAMVPIGSPVPVAALGIYWCASVEPEAVTIERIEGLARMAEAAIARCQTGARPL